MLADPLDAFRLCFVRPTPFVVSSHLARAFSRTVYTNST